MDKAALEQHLQAISSRQQIDKNYFLQLLDEDQQRIAETEHLKYILQLLKRHFILRLQKKIMQAKEEIALCAKEELTATVFQQIASLKAQIVKYTKEIDGYKSYFTEPYFARMDVEDEKEGYNRYYIGKKGNYALEIVDWRAPLARKYYQKSQIHFQINNYDYTLILRRALKIYQGKLITFKNEYLNVKKYLTKEEIAGRDEQIIFDPFLKEILNERKNRPEIGDIIQTIQEKQYLLITQPENANFIVQGCAGSGKTMILLHRLSYLLYNNEKLHAKDILVITPSSSFNHFIEELAQMLQLEKVKTKTIDSYFLALLESAKMHIADKIDREFLPPQTYLKEIYSEAFYQEIEQALKKIFQELQAIFLSAETMPYLKMQQNTLKEGLQKYAIIKNASIRIRRAIMGEIKEKSGKGFWFTKQFRELMNAVILVESFLSTYFTTDKFTVPQTFYRYIIDFYQAGKFIDKNTERIFTEAKNSIEQLQIELQKEIVNLKRYKVKRGDGLVESYQDRIAKRAELLEECKYIQNVLIEIEDAIYQFKEIFAAMQNNSILQKVGNATTSTQLARFFYKKLIRPVKDKYQLPKGLLLPSDGYLLALLLTMLGVELTPRYSLVFIDEGQDISMGEYQLLKKINSYAAFNIYGDLKQNIRQERGIESWEKLADFVVHPLQQNYRNTAQIIQYVQRQLNINMQPIALEGQAVQKISLREMKKFLLENGGLKAIIVSESLYHKHKKKMYNLPRETEKISKTKINYLTVYESKGLEFNSVVVLDKDMTENERYVAYTRALKSLAIAN